jgi:hypothetical protein
MNPAPLLSVEENRREATTEYTLRELLETLNDFTDDDHEVAVAVANLVNNGQVRLSGNFAGAQFEMPESFTVVPESMWPALLSLHDVSAHRQAESLPRLAA